MLEQAERDLRAGRYITAANFEQLSEKYSIALPIKLVGWLRKHCGSIQIKPHDEILPEGLTWQTKYAIRYYCDKGHTSTSICTYADMLGDILEL